MDLLNPEIGIAAALGAALYKITELIVNYLADKYLRTFGGKVADEKSAFELYNEMLKELNQMQNDLINTKFQLNQIKIELNEALNKEKKCIQMLEEFKLKLEKHEKNLNTLNRTNGNH